MKDTQRALAYPGNSIVSTVTFTALYSVDENTVERQVVMGISVPGGTQVNAPASASDVLSASMQQGTGTLVIGPGQLGQLTNLGFSANAQALISAAVNSGKVVVAPGGPVNMPGSAGTAWYELDPNTGAIVDTNEIGGHQAMVEYTGVALAAGILAAILQQVYPLMVKFKVTICGSAPAQVSQPPSLSTPNTGNTVGDSIQQSASVAAANANGAVTASGNILQQFGCTVINIAVQGTVRLAVILIAALVIGVLVALLIAALAETAPALLTAGGLAYAAAGTATPGAFGLAAFSGLPWPVECWGRRSRRPSRPLNTRLCPPNLRSRLLPSSRGPQPAPFPRD